jgi:hypothetical protein
MHWESTGDFGIKVSREVMGKINGPIHILALNWYVRSFLTGTKEFVVGLHNECNEMIMQVNNAYLKHDFQSKLIGTEPK